MRKKTSRACLNSKTTRSSSHSDQPLSRRIVLRYLFCCTHLNMQWPARLLLPWIVIASLVCRTSGTCPPNIALLVNRTLEKHPAGPSCASPRSLDYLRDRWGIALWLDPSSISATAAGVGLTVRACAAAPRAICPSRAELSTLLLYARLMGRDVAASHGATLLGGADPSGGGSGGGGGDACGAWEFAFDAPRAGAYELEVVHTWVGGAAEPNLASADAVPSTLWVFAGNAVDAARAALDWEADGLAKGSQQVSCAERCHQRETCTHWHQAAGGKCALFDAGRASASPRRESAPGAGPAGVRPDEEEHVAVGGLSQISGGWLSLSSACRAHAHALGSPVTVTVPAAASSHDAAFLPRCADALAATRCAGGAWRETAACDAFATKYQRAIGVPDERAVARLERLTAHQAALSQAASVSGAAVPDPAAAVLRWACPGDCALPPFACARRAATALRGVRAIVFWGISPRVFFLLSIFFLFFFFFLI